MTQQARSRLERIRERTRDDERWFINRSDVAFMLREIDRLDAAVERARKPNAERDGR